MRDTKHWPISQEQVLQAFRYVKANRGGCGVDGQSILKFENKLADNLYRIWNRMASGSYFPHAVKAVPIAKKNGGKRILGIPTVSDRVAQTVVKMHLEPIMESVFDADSYGYRPGRSAHQAIAVTRKRCWQYDWVVDFDISKLFDQIDHCRMMKALRFHVKDKWVLLYVERWLKAPLKYGDGRTERRCAGTPQGGVISPLLANLFLHYTFDAWMRRRFPSLVFCRYSDDGLIHCHSQDQAKYVLRALTARFLECDLELNLAKTSIVYCRDSNRQQEYSRVHFDFLGYRFLQRRAVSRAAKVFASFSPAVSPMAEKAIRAQMRGWNLRSRTFLSLREVAARASPIIRGWLNYYCKFNKASFDRIGAYINSMLVKWAMHKFKRLRRQRGKANHWLAEVMRQRPSLFPHWSAGFKRIVE